MPFRGFIHFFLVVNFNVVFGGVLRNFLVLQVCFGQIFIQYWLIDSVISLFYLLLDINSIEAQHYITLVHRNQRKEKI